MVIADASKLTPFFPLRCTRQYVLNKLLRDKTSRHTVLNVNDELAFFPEHLLEALDLRKEVDNVLADFANHLYLVKPCVGLRLATGRE